jgi:acyl-CoA reductase-like NAD-dependent aldehyde dehydrogenase
VRDRVEDCIAMGNAQGARLVVIAREEIFGSSSTMTPCADDDDAVRVANDCDYGLGCTVWTTDEQRGAQVARRIEAETVGINHYMPEHNSPTSMIKATGVGVKYGRESLTSFQRFQSIYL